MAWTDFLDISIHAPPRGATPPLALARATRSYFNSRPSARGDAAAAQSSAAVNISIHAPPRGATTRPFSVGFWAVISIHAPPRGATLRDIVPVCSFQNFNSRPSARGDERRHCRRHRVRDFNSRPSARGDVKTTVFFSSSSNFNSRPSARGDDGFDTYIQRVGEFQFTPLREGRRQAAHALYLPKKDFNSRPSARGDGKRYAISANLLFNPYKSAWLNNSATQFVEIILVIFHRIIA